MPPKVPRRTSLRHAAKAVHNPIPFLTENIKNFGKAYSFHIGGVRKGILTTDPEMIQHILQKNNRNYRKSRMQTEILGHYVGKGLLTSEGAFWLRQRRLIQPAFHRSKLNGLVGIVQEEIEKFFSANWKNGGRRELYTDMHHLAFRVVARSLFSTALDDAEILDLSKQISAIQSFVVKRIRQPYLHYWLHLNGQMRHHDRVSASVRQTILDVIRKRKDSGAESNDLLSLLLSVRYEDTGEPMSEEQILDESLILFTAGHETTAVALSWTFYLLAKHPQYLEMIREETPSGGFTSLEEVMRMQMTTQVIEESMRIYPPAWLIDRLSNSDDAVGNFSYPKDTFFIIWIYGLHNDPDLWPHPEVFDPGRFDPALKKARKPFSYIPFGAGPRLCIGHQFAMMEMIQAVAHVATNYNYELIDHDVGLRPLVTLRPKSTVPITVSDLR
ncbi:MAG: cytochrome P450 [Bacteroidetes bacterium]|nr:MAG: cytochrome P450 [Bacteroidota bacterium]